MQHFLHKIKQIISSETFILLIVLLVSGIMHGYNMFHYPYFENDEGVYFSQAWSFLSQGKLAPYTYWYDHAPVGWIFTSIWIFLTHGLFTFGFSLNSARVFMLVIHLFNTWFLFKIAKKLTGSVLGAILATLFIIFSPLAIYFQRRLLLDNIMTFWLLFSLYFIVYPKQKLFRFFLSAISFGIAVLSKENAIFFLPAYAFMVATETRGQQRWFAVIQWFIIVCVIISFYPLYALLKGEFFPPDTLLGGTSPHVSLLGSLAFQSSRGTGLPFWNPKSDFMYNFVYWLQRDQLLMTLGSICFFIQGIFAFFNKNSRAVFLVTISMFAFLASGKLVINFYVIPFIPLLGLCIAMTITQFAQIAKRLHPFFTPALIISCITILVWFYSNDIFVHQALTSDETTPQLQAVQWVEQHINPQQTIAIDNYAALNLGEKQTPSDHTFSNAYWYWKVDFDPDITTKKLRGSSKNINYFMLTAQMSKDISTYDKSHSLLAQALNNSTMVAFFGQQPPKNVTLANYTASHPNGDWVAIYKQNSLNDVLANTWNSYKTTYITPAGQVLDPQTKQTDGRQVGYTLLRAALEDDPKTFAKVFSWTQKNMQLDNGLFATSYGATKIGKEGELNTGTTTDADQYIAYALAIGGQKWKNTMYIHDSQNIISGIWDNDTAVVNGARYVTAGNWTSQANNDKFVINPSELNPAIYRTFEKIDSEHNWTSIIDSSYSVLTACSKNKLGVTNAIFLPPNWCDITKDGAIIPAKEVADDSSDYSYEAYRVSENIAADYAISHDTRALAYLKQLHIFQTEWQNKQIVYATLTHAGVSNDQNQSLGQYASILDNFIFTNNSASEALYNTKISPEFTNDGTKSYWGNKNDLFDQNWVWLCLYLYAHPTQ